MATAPAKLQAVNHPCNPRASNIAIAQLGIALVFSRNAEHYSWALRWSKLTVRPRAAWQRRRVHSGELDDESSPSPKAHHHT